jgi:hypothetical protein
VTGAAAAGVTACFRFRVVVGLFGAMSLVSVDETDYLGAQYSLRLRLKVPRWYDLGRERQALSESGIGSTASATDSSPCIDWYLITAHILSM